MKFTPNQIKALVALGTGELAMAKTTDKAAGKVCSGDAQALIDAGLASFAYVGKRVHVRLTDEGRKAYLQFAS